MKFFLTGGTGLVGSNFIRVASERYKHNVFAALNQSKLEAQPNLTMAKIDLLDADAVLDSVRSEACDAIIHMAFYNDFLGAYRNREASWALMVSATENLVNAAKACNIPMLFVSTDWVFDGTQSPAKESTPPYAINLYGSLKLIGETVTRQYERGIVARIAGVYGVNWASGGRELSQNAGFGNIPNLVVDKLSKHELAEIWMQETNLNLCATPSLASDCCDMMIQLLEHNASGIFHCVGAEHISRTDYARATANAFGLDSSLIRTIPVDVTNPESFHGIPIPKDSSLDGTHTAGILGKPLRPLDEGLRIFKRQLELGEL